MSELDNFQHIDDIGEGSQGVVRLYTDVRLGRRVAIKSLHPTPAVCGYPKNDARRFILEHEPNERELYTGYITCALEGVSYAFVNLRCAKVFSNGIRIFAGGGINKWSDPESEWLETKQKIESVKNVLVSSDNNK